MIVMSHVHVRHPFQGGRKTQPCNHAVLHDCRQTGRTAGLNVDNAAAPHMDELDDVRALTAKILMNTMEYFAIPHT